MLNTAAAARAAKAAKGAETSDSRPLTMNALGSSTSAPHNTNSGMPSISTQFANARASLSGYPPLLNTDPASMFQYHQGVDASAMFAFQGNSFDPSTSTAIPSNSPTTAPGSFQSPTFEPAELFPLDMAFVTRSTAVAEMQLSPFGKSSSDRSIATPKASSASANGRRRSVVVVLKPGFSYAYSTWLKRDVPATCFYLFPKLPLEIRLMIWRKVDVANDVQDVIVRSCPSINAIDFRIFKALTPTPVVLHICSESRNELIKSYKLCFREVDDTRSIYVNFSKSTLFVVLQTEKEALSDWKGLIGDEDHNIDTGSDVSVPVMANGGNLQLERYIYNYNMPHDAKYRYQPPWLVGTPLIQGRAIAISSAGSSLSRPKLPQKKAYFNRICEASGGLGGLQNIEYRRAFEPEWVKVWDAAWWEYAQLNAILSPARKVVKKRLAAQRLAARKRATLQRQAARAAAKRAVAQLRKLQKASAPAMRPANTTAKTVVKKAVKKTRAVIKRRK